MLEFRYQYKYIADGSRIDSSEFEDLFRKFMNTLLDLRLIAPVVTEETTITITLKKFISVEENKFEIIKLRYNKEFNRFEILFCDMNRPWQEFFINIPSIEDLIIFCLPENIKSLIELITPQIDKHKIKLLKEINDWIAAGRPDNANPVVPVEIIPVVEEVPLSTKTNIFVPGIITDDE